MLSVSCGSGADFWLGKLHGLALVLDISVAGNLGIALKQVLEYNNGFDVFVGDIDFCGGIGDFAPIGGVDGQSVNVDIAAGVGGLGGAAPIAAGDLELDALHLSVLGGLDQTCAAYRVCFHLDVTAYGVAS